MNSLQEMAEKISAMAKGYTQAMRVTEEDEVCDNPLSSQSAKKIIEDCQKFYDSMAIQNVDLRVCTNKSETVDFEQIGRDFWYTRNGHGVGFWDRPHVYIEDSANQLCDIVEMFGETWFYTGNDGFVYEM